MYSAELWKVSSSGTGKAKVADLAGQPSRLCGHSGSNTLYYTNFSEGKIHKITADGTTSGVIVSGLTNPVGIAIRPASGWMYFCDGFASPNNSIQRCTLDGDNLTTILAQADVPSGYIDVLWGLDLDLINQKIVWGGGVLYSSDNTMEIFRCNFDGTSAEEVVNSGTWGTFGPSVDASGGKMYFNMASGQSGIFRCNLNGSGIENILSDGAFEVGIIQGVCTDATLPAEGSGAQTASISGLPVKNIHRMVRSDPYHYPYLIEELPSGTSSANIQIWDMTSGSGVAVSISNSGCDNYHGDYWRWSTQNLPWDGGQYTYHYFYRMITDLSQVAYGEFVINLPGYNQYPDGGFVRAN